EPAVWHWLRAKRQTFALFGLRIGFVWQFLPARHEFADAFAWKFERAWKRFFAVFRKLPEHRRKKFRRRFRFDLLGRAGVRIEFGRRQRRLFILLVLCEQSCTCKN